MSKKTSDFSNLMTLFKDQKLLVSIALLGGLVQVGLMVYLPVLIGEAIDSLLLLDNKSQLGAIIWQMLAIILINSLLQWANPLLYNRLVYRMTANLRQAAVFKIHRLPLSYLDRQSVGDMVSRITADTEQLSNGLLMVFNQFFTGSLTIILTILAMGRIDSLMMVFVIILSPLSLLLARFMAKKSFTLYQRQTQSRGQQLELLEESINQQSLIQQFNGQDDLEQAFKQVNQEYSRWSLGAIFYSSAINPATRFVNALIYALLAGLGGWRIINGGFTIGQLTTFLNYANQYTKPFNDISSVYGELQSALACARRIFSVLEEEDMGILPKGQLDRESVRGQIVFDKVNFSYQKGRPLIQDLNLSIPAGSRVAIVGPTGAGKTTMINLLMRFYDVDAGQILIDGVAIDDYRPDDLRKQIGLVLQETWIKSATVHDNIAYGQPEASREAVIAAAKLANADFFINQLPQAYDTFLDGSTNDLSQGQAQLLAIARVFLREPKILILDEATSSIDRRTEGLIQDALDLLMQGRTSFIIAHRLATIEGADLILVMENGRVVESGNHKELMADKGLYYTMQSAKE